MIKFLLVLLVVYYYLLFFLLNIALLSSKLKSYFDASWLKMLLHKACAAHISLLGEHLKIKICTYTFIVCFTDLTPFIINRKSP